MNDEEREARVLGERLGAHSLYLCRSGALCGVQVQFGDAYLSTEDTYIRPADAWREMRDALAAIEAHVMRTGGDHG